jgi:hypothetical protein
MFKSFQEYIDQNKKLVEKPKVAKVADFEGKQPVKPEKEKKAKDAGGSEQVGEVKPYSNGENAKDPHKDDKAGLGYKGDSGLVYEPKVDEKSKETKTWPKTGMSEWVKETKNLSVADLARKIKEENKGCSEGIHEVAKKLVEACKCNNKNVTTFVREAKRGRVLESLMKELFNLQESYEILSGLIESKLYSSKFDKMFNEMVAEPVGMEGERSEEDHEEDEMGNMEDKEDHEEEDMSDMEDEEDEMGDMEDEEDDMSDMEDEEDDEEEDMSDMEDEEGNEEDDMGDMEDEEGYEGDMEDMEGSGEVEGMVGPENPFLPKNFK